ncbi:hypothetical protein A0256_20275 [Mucilaginibacter sp. PAMC 26640]|nr:hypothetical protein A0256_20275 [Mucilaginibacter sp. PAMC 26640]
MKLRFLLISLFSLSSFAGVYGQNKVSLNLKSADFKKALAAIEKQSPYHFVYSERKIPTTAKFSLTVDKEDALVALDKLLANTGFTYNKLSNNIIVILPVGEQLGSSQITGTVAADNALPLIGATVQLQGSTISTATDINGKFSLDVPVNSQLTITYVGYVPQTFTIKDYDPLSIRMLPEDNALSEVIITALGLKKSERRLGYSVTQISGDEVSETREPTFINALAGKVAGLIVQSPPNGPGGSSRVILRGYSSFSGSNQPLYVIDGIPINSDTRENTEDPLKIYGGADPGDGLASINPDDIESISILKGASAAALYGGSAQAGVILITTKKASGTNGLGITFNSNTVLEKMVPYGDLQYQYGRGNNGMLYTAADNISNNYYLTGQSWGVPFSGQMALGADGQIGPYQPQTAKQRFNTFFNTGFSTTNSLALAKTIKDGSFRVSASQTKSNSPIPGSGFERYNGLLKFIQDFGKRIHTDIKIDASRTQRLNIPLLRGDDRGSFAKYFIRSDNVTDIAFLDKRDAEGNYLYTYTNPYIGIEKVINNQTQNRIISSANISVDLTNHLQANLISGIDYVNTDGLFVNFPNNKNGGGSITTTNFNQQRSDVRGMLLYNQSFGNISLSGFAGAELQQATFKSVTLTGVNLADPNLVSLGNVTVGQPVQITIPRSKTNSVFGEAQIGFKNYLFLEITGRNDWFSALTSSRPGFTNHIFYPSANLSYIFTDALKIDPQILSFGKLRLAVGQTSSNPVPNQTDLTFKFTPTVNGIPGQEISNTSLPPSGLKPENTTETEIGTELKFFKDRLFIDFAWYNKTSKNFLLPIALPTATGFNATYQNAGSMYNRGIELLVNATAIRTKNFSWDVSINYAKNKNLVTSLNDALKTNGVSFYYNIKAKAGYPLGSIFGTPFRRDAAGQLVYKAISANGSGTADAVVIDKGALTFDSNGNPVKTAGGMLAVNNEVYLGSTNPDWTGGITNSFRFKNLRLSFLIDGRFGGKIYEDGARWANFFGNSTTSVLGRDGKYIPQGMVNTGTDAAPNYVKNTLPYNPYQQYNANGTLAYYVDESSVFSRTFIKLRQVSLGYTLPRRLLGNGPVKSATFSLIARNLLYFRKDLPIFDPDASDSIGNGYGYDTGGLPASRTYGFNLNIVF